MEKIVLVGFGGHAKSITDSIESIGYYELAGFIDLDLKQDFQYHGHKVIGTDDDAQKIFDMGIKNAFISIGYVKQTAIRSELYKYYKEIGFDFPAIIDKSAVLAMDCKVGEGAFIGKKAVVNANASIGNLAIINTGAIIEHDVNVGNYSHVAIGATLCGGCMIGKNCLVGANSTVLQQLSVGDDTMIGAGAVVTKDIEKKKVVVGVPAKEIERVEE